MIGTRMLARIPRDWRVRRPPPTQRWIAWTLLVAVGYILAGRMGQLLAFPPNYATAIWPPSGIALAAVLLIGRSRLAGCLSWRLGRQRLDSLARLALNMVGAE